MKKDEFFEVLKKKLVIIEENELNDILNEYEQHISMKMQNGNITEEEAIKDFGNIDELVAEILESYHVKVNYNAKIKEEKQAQLKESAKEIGENTKHFCGKVFQKAKVMLKNGWSSVKAFLKNIYGKVKLDAEKPDQQNELPLNVDNFLQEIPMTAIENQGRLKMWIKKLGFWCRKVIKACVKLCIWCIRIIWNLCVLGFAFLLTIFSCFMLYVFGASIVLLVEDYPLWGVLFISLGAVIFSAAAITGTGLLIRKKKNSKRFLTEKARGIVKIVVVVCLAFGVVLGGIGTGIGFVEFSSFTYGGEKSLFKEEKTVTRVTTNVPLGNIGRIELENIYDGHDWIEPEVVFDATIPQGQICYEIVNNQKDISYMADSYITYEEEYEDTQGQEGDVYRVYLSQGYGRNELKVIMEIKDEMLKDIKERKVYSYKTNEMISAKILVNPQMKKYF